jgi:hypothetical protein
VNAEDVPLELPDETAPENHWSRWTNAPGQVCFPAPALEEEPDDYVPGRSCQDPIPCPPFEDVRLEISPEAPEPGAFARAVFGDEWTERTAAEYARRREVRLEHRSGAVTGFVEPGTFD